MADPGDGLGGKQPAPSFGSSKLKIIKRNKSIIKQINEIYKKQQKKGNIVRYFSQIESS